MPDRAAHPEVGYRTLDFDKDYVNAKYVGSSLQQHFNNEATSKVALCLSNHVNLYLSAAKNTLDTIPKLASKELTIATMEEASGKL